MEQHWSAFQETQKKKEERRKNKRRRENKNSTTVLHSTRGERDDEPRRRHRTRPLPLHAACPRRGHLSSPHKHTSKHARETTWKARRGRSSSESRARSRVPWKPPPPHSPLSCLPFLIPSREEGHRRLSIPARPPNRPRGTHPLLLLSLSGKDASALSRFVYAWPGSFCGSWLVSQSGPEIGRLPFTGCLIRPRFVCIAWFLVGGSSQYQVMELGVLLLHSCKSFLKQLSGFGSKIGGRRASAVFFLVWLIVLVFLPLLCSSECSFRSCFFNLQG